MQPFLEPFPAKIALKVLAFLIVLATSVTEKKYRPLRNSKLPPQPPMFNVVGVTRGYKRRDCTSDTFFRSPMCTQCNVGSNIEVGGERGIAVDLLQTSDTFFRRHWNRKTEGQRHFPLIVENQTREVPSVWQTSKTKSIAC